MSGQLRFGRQYSYKIDSFDILLGEYLLNNDEYDELVDQIDEDYSESLRKYNDRYFYT